jgi:outer membrane protein insertion porin family
VVIIYTVTERPSDQLELSAGWGGFGRSRVIVTLGVVFNNFSLRNVLDRESWHPLPQGDGQKLSLRAQTNGDFYQSYNFSFTEPWLGGKKPMSFTLGGIHTSFNNELFNGGKLAIDRAFAGIGTRLHWPDDNFIFNATGTVEGLSLDNYATGDFVDKDGNLITDGNYNNLSLSLTLARNTVNEPIFPRSGGKISLTAKLTPPYSALGRDVNMDDPKELYRWVEYHKWRLDVEWYAPLGSKLVLKTAAKMGYLGFYNPDIGTPPFERFELGGDGISNQRFGITGKDIISLRAYETGDIAANSAGGAAIFNKYTVELRYPVSLNPSTTIFGLGFIEGGNSWTEFSAYNPFDLRRSAGFGVRVFLHMFGLLGFDYGWGWDKPALIESNAKWSEFGKFSLILGFEPD